jgi:glycerophosphoryl diester phosphodiesterase
MSIRCVDRMQLIAHRGASYDAPENTVASARLAWAQHADALEVDVHLTRDGRLAVIHDPDTQRTGVVRHIVAEATLAELQQLDVGGWKDVRFSGEKIPSLEEIFAIVPAGKRVFVELKGGPESVPPLQRCVRSLEDNGAGFMPAQVAVIAFDLETAVAAKRGLPAHEVCWLADHGAEAPRATLQEIADTARREGLDGVDVDHRWLHDGKVVQQIRVNGFKVYVWTETILRSRGTFLPQGSMVSRPTGPAGYAPNWRALRFSAELSTERVGNRPRCGWV